MNKIVLMLLFCLTACSPYIQTTSGKSYLEKYKDAPLVANASDDPINIEDRIRQVAAVEPILSFPARIGLARIDNGQLVTLPGIEIEAWQQVRDELGQDFGEFVPLNVLVADLVSRGASSGNTGQVTDVVSKIRLGAARQHLDAVLIYEAYSETDHTSNFLAIADLTLIGSYLLPSRAIESQGFANAILIDVIQGYPYGSVDVTLEKNQVHSTGNGVYKNRRDLAASVETKAVNKLSRKVGTMFEDLRRALKEKTQQESG